MGIAEVSLGVSLISPLAMYATLCKATSDVDIMMPIIVVSFGGAIAVFGTLSTHKRTLLYISSIPLMNKQHLEKKLWVQHGRVHRTRNLKPKEMYSPVNKIIQLGQLDGEEVQNILYQTIPDPDAPRDGCADVSRARADPELLGGHTKPRLPDPSNDYHHGTQNGLSDTEPTSPEDQDSKRPCSQLLSCRSLHFVTGLSHSPQTKLVRSAVVILTLLTDFGKCKQSKLALRWTVLQLKWNKVQNIRVLLVCEFVCVRVCGFVCVRLQWMGQPCPVPALHCRDRWLKCQRFLVRLDPTWSIRSYMFLSQNKMK